jgi:hypothetical protein
MPEVKDLTLRGIFAHAVRCTMRVRPLYVGEHAEAVDRKTNSALDFCVGLRPQRRPFCLAVLALIALVLPLSSLSPVLAREDGTIEEASQQSTSPEKRTQPDGLPDDVSLVPEMAGVQELGYLQGKKGWSEKVEADLKDDINRANAAWKKESKRLTMLLTVAHVRSLSRWAKEQMRAYQTVPSLGDVRLQPIGLDERRGRIVLEGTIDTLPSHHPLVTRWLKVYVLYDILDRKITHVTLTIRGQVLE